MTTNAPSKLIRVTDEAQRLARVSAAILGVTQEEWVSDLIVVNAPPTAKKAVAINGTPRQKGGAGTGQK